jgi:hypothetical protein
VAEEFNRRPVNAALLVQTEGIQCVIYGGQSGTLTGCPLIILLHKCYHQTYITQQFTASLNSTLAEKPRSLIRFTAHSLSLTTHLKLLTLLFYLVHYNILVTFKGLRLHKAYVTIDQKGQ